MRIYEKSIFNLFLLRDGSMREFLEAEKIDCGRNIEIFSELCKASKEEKFSEIRFVD